MCEGDALIVKETPARDWEFDAHPIHLERNREGDEEGERGGGGEGEGREGRREGGREGAKQGGGVAYRPLPSRAPFASSYHV